MYMSPFGAIVRSSGTIDWPPTRSSTVLSCRVAGSNVTIRPRRSHRYMAPPGAKPTQLSIVVWPGAFAYSVLTWSVARSIVISMGWFGAAVVSTK
ncbi:hypothetical protein ABH926_003434 [Catenulispora sp. GP43]|uniref:hypothetical protein n=1 Tax=Catenulispora sp. GP43 TaxID=3156263 RepID=UPI0035196954